VRSGAPHLLWEHGAIPGIGLAVLYAIPSFLTVRSLRRVRLRGLLG
jgi:hypothetical protein